MQEENNKISMELMAKENGHLEVLLLNKMMLLI